MVSFIELLVKIKINFPALMLKSLPGRTIMNRLLISILTLLLCLVSACRPVPEQYMDLESHIVKTAASQTVLIQVNHGEVIILESDGQNLRVGGQVLFADGMDYQVSSAENQILVKANVSRVNSVGSPLRIEVHVPKNMDVKVETESASIFVTKYHGVLEVASTSGNISIEEVIGRLTLRSNRGNIMVSKSSGIISVVGNYGALTVQDVNGKTGISTIMGKVVFDGMVQDGDFIHIETDHGSVSVNLKRDSALSFEAHTTSGEMVCLLPYLSSTTRTCDGKIGVGNGGLKIRTVSGPVTMQLLP